MNFARYLRHLFTFFTEHLQATVSVLPRKFYQGNFLGSTEKYFTNEIVKNHLRKYLHQVFGSRKIVPDEKLLPSSNSNVNSKPNSEPDGGAGGRGGNFSRGQFCGHPSLHILFKNFFDLFSASNDIL